MLLGVLGVKLQNQVQTRSDLLAVLQKNFAAIREFRPTRNKVTGLAVEREHSFGTARDQGRSARVVDRDESRRSTGGGPNPATGQRGFANRGPSGERRTAALDARVA
jgi:hypothetical protein